MTTPHKPVSAYALHRIYGSVAPTAARIINDQRVSHPQMLLFRDTGNEPVFVRAVTPEVVLMLHVFAKQVIPKFIAGEFDRHGERVDVVVHISEASGAPTTAQTSNLLRAGVPVRELPGARDVLSITLHTRDGIVSSIMPIEKRDDRFHVELVPLDLDAEWLDGISPDGLDAARKMSGAQS